MSGKELTRVLEAAVTYFPELRHVVNRWLGPRTRLHSTSRWLRGIGNVPLATSWRRREIQKVAVVRAKQYYAAHGYSVCAVERERCGYDLLCAKGGELLHITVKGSISDFPSFDVTESEYERAQDDPGFRLAFLSNIYERLATLREYTGDELLDQFTFRPVQYFARARREG